MVDLLLPDVSDPEVALLLGTLDKATREWRKQLGDVSPEALRWQPVPNGHSIGAVLLHIANGEGHCLLEGVVGQTRTPEERARLLSTQTDPYGGKCPVPPAEPQGWFYEQQNAVRERTVAAFQDMTELTQTRFFRGDDHSVRWFLAHIIGHEAYHGGQAVLLHELYKAGQA